MNDNSNESRALTTPQRMRLEDTLSPESQNLVVSHSAGGVSFATAGEVMDMAKMMATADRAVPKHLRRNAGACLAVVFQAVEWRMSPFAVANKSYEVNDRIAYEAQLVHAVVEARAPLKERLSTRYEGVGNELKIIVTGVFRDGAVREYESPMVKDIKVKNSPLWTADVKQQLHYYGTRAWARRWVPDVLMGIYTPDELQDNPRLGREEEPIVETVGQRLAARADQGEEGFDHDRVASEIDQIAPNAGKGPAAAGSGPAQEPEQKPAPEQPAKETPASGRASPGKRGSAKKGAKAADAKSAAAPEPAFDSETPLSKIETPAQYLRWWQDKVERARAAGQVASDMGAIYWSPEHEKSRTDLGVPVSIRNRITEELIAGLSPEES